MARPRNTRGKARKTSAENTEAPQATSTNTTSERNVNRMAALTPEQIQALLGKRRQKGIYIQKLNEFLASGEAGISVKETWPEFKDKKDTTLKQGFDNAKDHKDINEGADQVSVISSEDDVYLVNLAVAANELGEEAVTA